MQTIKAQALRLGPQLVLSCVTESVCLAYKATQRQDNQGVPMHLLFDIVL